MNKLQGFNTLEKRVTSTIRNYRPRLAAEILVLRGEIVHLLGHRIESQLEDNGVLDFYHTEESE
jgi:hypothetical protein